MKNIAVVFGGGSGARMGTGIPKQFIEVNGKSIFIHTLEIFDDSNDIDAIYISCREDYINLLKRQIRKFGLTKVAKIVPGGKTGQDSILNALKAIEEDEEDAIVLIHDCVRPMITAELIKENIDSVKKYGSAITCTPMFETPIISNDGVHIDDAPLRSLYYTAQAPQCFYLKEVLKAHEITREKNPGYAGIVDTCTLMKSVGKEVSIVKGPRGNIKVTTPEDLYIFRALVNYRESEQIFGFSNKEVDKNLKK